MTSEIINRVLVTNGHNGIATFANDDNIQAIVLRNFFTASVEIASPQIEKNRNDLVVQILKEANKTGLIPDTTELSQKEYEYAQIALNLKDLLEYTTGIYTQKHGLEDSRSIYSPRVRTNRLEKTGRSQGIMEATTAFMTDDIHLLNTDVHPKTGDLVIIKGLKTSSVSSSVGDLIRSSHKASMGISTLAFPNREI